MKLDTLEMRREYVEGTAPLMLWYAWTLLNNKGLGFDAIFAQRVGIRDLTLFAGDPDGGKPANPDGWLLLLEKLRQLYDTHQADATTTALEAEGLTLLWPTMEPHIETVATIDERWLQNAVGCFGYEYHFFYPEPDSEDYLTLHVRNAYQPDSPFRHLPEMIASLHEIVERAIAERPDVTWVQCATWINSVPAFAGLFPASWIETALPGKPGSHTGWWGQFMDRRGGFNVKNAQRFRETGQFPYRHIMCRCTITELRKHIEGLTR